MIFLSNIVFSKLRPLMLIGQLNNGIHKFLYQLISIYYQPPYKLLNN